MNIKAIFAHNNFLPLSQCLSKYLIQDKYVMDTSFKNVNRANSKNNSSNLRFYCIRKNCFNIKCEKSIGDI